MTTDRLEWFISRLWQKVYRTRTDCRCVSCDTSYYQGIVIHDELHAHYLRDMEAETEIKYFGSREERDEFEKTLK